MPTPGLSLVGFMSDQQQALSHLKNSCVPDPSKSDADLIADWHAARAQIGAPIQRAGQPNMQPIPMTDPHIVQLMQVPWAPFFMPLIMQGANFQMIEIEPLLAFQFTVDATRSHTHCGALDTPPSRDELLNLCLPFTQSNDAVHISGAGGRGVPTSIIIKSRSLNLGMVLEGPLNPNAQDVWGIQWSWALPFVHVVRLNHRCYLHNGYHRALGLSRAGAPMMPCIFRDVPTPEAANILPPLTFDLPLLESGDPPTIEHYAKARAYAVALRASSRIIQISWAQHTIYDE